MAYEQVASRVATVTDKAGYAVDAAQLEALWMVCRENVQTVEEIAVWIPIAFGDITPLIDDEDEAFLAEAAELCPEGEMTSDVWKAFMGTLKSETGRKGKALFMPLRKALTGQGAGPVMDQMAALMGRDRIVARLRGGKKLT